MKLNKSIHEYTVAGLLFVASQTKDDLVKSAILVELRKRREMAGVRSIVNERNRLEKSKLIAELEIEGLRSKDEQIRRNANRDLFATMKDLAFETVEIPTGLSPTETVKKYNADVHCEAKRLYNEFKKTVKKTEITERRDRVVNAGKEYHAKQVERKRLRAIKERVYRNARFPLIDHSVRYTDTYKGVKRVGTIRGITFNRTICSFIVRVKNSEGHRVGRVLSAIEPLENTDGFKEVIDLYKEYESYMRLVRDRDTLRVKVSVYADKITELNSLIDDYKVSKSFSAWHDNEREAKESARNTYTENSTELF
jgi:hypothetical protein